MALNQNSPFRPLVKNCFNGKSVTLTLTTAEKVEEEEL